MRQSSADIRQYAYDSTPRSEGRSLRVDRKTLPDSRLKKAVVEAGYNRVAQAKLLRLESKRAAQTASRRSPANKLARTILSRGQTSIGKSGFYPADVAFKAGIRGIQAARTGNPELAASFTRKAVIINKAKTIASRMRNHMSGPGGKKIEKPRGPLNSDLKVPMSNYVSGALAPRPWKR